jgi:hypothetical protein
MVIKTARASEGLKRGAPLGIFCFAICKQLCQERIRFFKINITACRLLSVYFPVMCLWSFYGKNVVYSLDPIAIERPIRNLNEIFFWTAINEICEIWLSKREQSKIFEEFKVHDSVHRNNILIYIQKSDITQFILSGNCSTCFGRYQHPSSGAKTTISTASGIFHTVIAICRYRGRDGTGLSVLWVAYATHSTLKPIHCFILVNNT